MERVECGAHQDQNVRIPIAAQHYLRTPASLTSTASAPSPGAIFDKEYLPPATPNLFGNDSPAIWWPMPIMDTDEQSHSFSAQPGVTHAASTSQAMAPPILSRKRKKAPTMREKDWEPMKARIVELYVTNKEPLTAVREHVHAEFGLLPT